MIDTSDRPSAPGTETVEASDDTGETRGLDPRLQRLWLGGCGVFLVQGALAMVWSRHLWSRFSLTPDFATFFQAWHQIGTGHLNPYDTTFPWFYPHYGYPFWQSHFEIILWPLALLSNLVSSSSFVLLVIQDIAVAGAGLVAFRFGLEIVQARKTQSEAFNTAVALILLAALVLNPWTYWVLSYDFHLQPFAVLFALLCARDLWNGRSRTYLWALLTFSCGDVAGSYVIAVGVGALFTNRQLRRRGLALIASGVAWIAFVTAIGSGKGSSISFRYAYLAHVTQRIGVTATIGVLFGLVTHFGSVLHVLRERFGDMYKFIAGSGTIGIAAPVALPMALAVLIPNALDQSTAFLNAPSAFQSYIVTLMVALGSVFVLLYVATRWRHGMIAALFLGLLMVGQASYVSHEWAPQVRSTLVRVDSVTSRQLASVLRTVPPKAEVVVSQGVIGRFGGHRLVYPFLDVFADGQTIPVHASTVAFVFVPIEGLELATTSQTQAAIAQVRRLERARVIEDTSNVTAVIWHPPRGTTTIRFSP